MQRSENTTNEAVGRWVWESVREKARAAGEEVLWESTGTRGLKRMQMWGDHHGYYRWFASSWLLAGGGMLVVGVPCLLMMGVSAGHTLGLSLVAVAALFVGYEGCKKAREDSRARHYMLTERRLIVVGGDSFVEVPLADMTWVQTSHHRDSTGTLICGCERSASGNVVAIEGIEDCEQVRRLISRYAPRLLRHRLLSVLPRTVREELRGR